VLDDPEMDVPVARAGNFTPERVNEAKDPIIAGRLTLTSPLR
jgi:hypothetical protein